jgi:CubicO group peptidase (beta-lactamase class C family)
LAREIDMLGLDTFLNRQRRALNLPGLAVAVVQDGRIASLRGLGIAAPGRPMTPQTPLIIGSVSKSFTVLALMQLVEAGKIDLDAPVQQYIPWFCHADRDAAARITLRHLLTHTSGISRYDGRVLLGGRGGKSLEQSVRDLRSLKLSQPVGSLFQYSNTNYLIVGLIVEVVSGQSFGAYIQEHIFAPLGMKHSYTSEEATMHGGLACGYRYWFGLPFPYRAPYLDDAVPAAFLAASVEDQARYALALLNGGKLDGGSVLSPAGIAELHRPQVVATSPGASYALGWQVEKLGGVSIVRHGGEVSNFLAEVVLAPAHNLGVVVLTNANNGMIPLALPQTTRLASAVVRLLLGQPQPRQRTLWSFYGPLNAVLAALSVYQAWSAARLLRSCSNYRPSPAPRWRSAWHALATLVDLALPIAVLRLIPRRADAPWSLLRIYVPDVTAWLAAFCSFSLLKGLARLLLFRSKNR